MGVRRAVGIKWRRARRRGTDQRSRASYHNDTWSFGVVSECIEDFDIDCVRSVRPWACHSRDFAVASLEFGRIGGRGAAYEHLGMSWGRCRCYDGRIQVNCLLGPKDT